MQAANKKRESGVKPIKRQGQRTHDCERKSQWWTKGVYARFAQFQQITTPKAYKTPANHG